MKKLLVFAATNSKRSINKQLLTAATKGLSDTDVELLDLNDYPLPIYSIDLEEESGIPLAAQTLYKKIGSADAVMISFAEHNGSYAAVYKNIFDWMSRIERSVFQDRRIVYLATSPGPGGAVNVLQSAVNSAPFFAADLVGSHSIPNFFDNFDSANVEISNSEHKAAIDTLVTQLLR